MRRGACSGIFSLALGPLGNLSEWPAQCALPRFVLERALKSYFNDFFKEQKGRGRGR